jgi:hypothetical protein
VLVSVLFSQLLLVKVYEEEGHTAQQDAGGAVTEYIVFFLSTEAGVLVRKLGQLIPLS